jgi:small subunit ribosomal protein S7
MISCLPQNPLLRAVRLNTTTNNIPQHDESLISDLPQDEAEAWLSSIRELRDRYRTEGIPDYNSPAEKRLVKDEFEPSAEQIAKLESLQDKPIPIKHDPVVQHCTNMIMKHGKKATAEKAMARALYIVRLQLRLDPIEVLRETLDKMGPLMQLKTYKTRVAKNLVVPQPLNERQRNRRAFLWILEGCQKRRSRDFAVRLGEEIVSAYEGKSSGYEKRLQMHKAAMLHRSYIKLR